MSAKLTTDAFNSALATTPAPAVQKSLFDIKLHVPTIIKFFDDNVKRNMPNNLRTLLERREKARGLVQYEPTVNRVKMSAAYAHRPGKKDGSVVLHDPAVWKELSFEKLVLPSRVKREDAKAALDQKGQPIVLKTADGKKLPLFSIGEPKLKDGKTVDAGEVRIGALKVLQHIQTRTLFVSGSLHLDGLQTEYDLRIEQSNAMHARAAALMVSLRANYPADVDIVGAIGADGNFSFPVEKDDDLKPVLAWHGKNFEKNGTNIAALKAGAKVNGFTIVAMPSVNGNGVTDNFSQTKPTQQDTVSNPNAIDFLSVTNPDDWTNANFVWPMCMRELLSDSKDAKDTKSSDSVKMIDIEPYNNSASPTDHAIPYIVNPKLGIAFVSFNALGTDSSNYNRPRGNQKDGEKDVQKNFRYLLIATFWTMGIADIVVGQEITPDFLAFLEEYNAVVNTTPAETAYGAATIAAGAADKALDKDKANPVLQSEAKAAREALGTATVAAQREAQSLKLVYSHAELAAIKAKVDADKKAASASASAAKPNTL